jgi:hypothetical protein
MQNLLCITLGACLLFGTGCTSAVSTPSTSFLTAFPERSDWPDTLHCFLPETPVGNTLSDSLLKTVLDSAQFESLHYGTGDAHFRATDQFAFSDDLRAALVHTEEFWFGKQSLLVFDLRKQKCLEVVELAHFYGGDGGQTASESWLFGNKTAPRLFVKTAEHGLAPSESPTEELREYLQESGQLFQWAGRQFQHLPNPDSLRFLQQYRMHRTW